MTAVSSIRAMIIFKFSELLLILVDGAQFYIFEVPQNKSLSEFMDDDDVGGLDTVFIFKFDRAEESLLGELSYRGLEGLLATSNFVASSGTCSLVAGTLETSGVVAFAVSFGSGALPGVWGRFFLIFFN
jgi:hypothetical protein